MTDTYGDLKTKIADDLARSDLTSSIATAILDAIAQHQRERFYFNEVKDETFSTVAAQKWYTSAANAYIPNLLDIDSMKCTVSGNTYMLTRRPHSMLEDWDVSSFGGDPTDFAYYGQQLRLYPTPNAVRTITFSAHVRLTALSADADSNAWTKREDAEALIRHTALADLYANKIRNMDKATVAEGQAARCLSYLRSETTRRTVTGFVTATRF